MKKAALYARVSTVDQHPESQLLDLQQLAVHRGWEIAETYIDRGVSGTRTRRPALDSLMADAARHKFDIVAVAAFDRMARSVRHLLETLDDFRSPWPGVRVASRKHRQFRPSRPCSFRHCRGCRTTRKRLNPGKSPQRHAPRPIRGPPPGTPATGSRSRSNPS